MHAETVLEAGGKAVLLDINQDLLVNKVKKIKEFYGSNVMG